MRLSFHNIVACTHPKSKNSRLNFWPETARSLSFTKHVLSAPRPGLVFSMAQRAQGVGLKQLPVVFLGGASEMPSLVAPEALKAATKVLSWRLSTATSGSDTSRW
jgi:hypothetical protein